MAEELSDVRAKISELSERKIAAEDQLKHIDIRAPQTGRVHELVVHTVGGVITPGETIMLIVPDNDALSVQVKVSPNDIDELRPEQPALLRFSAFNMRTTPELNGTVSWIAADQTEDQRTGNAHYRAHCACRVRRSPAFMALRSYRECRLRPSSKRKAARCFPICSSRYGSGHARFQRDLMQNFGREEMDSGLQQLPFRAFAQQDDALSCQAENHSHAPFAGLSQAVLDYFSDFLKTLSDRLQALDLNSQFAFLATILHFFVDHLPDTSKPELQASDLGADAISLATSDPLAHVPQEAADQVPENLPPNGLPQIVVDHVPDWPRVNSQNMSIG